MQLHHMQKSTISRVKKRFVQQKPMLTLNSSLELPTICSRLGPKAGVMSVAVYPRSSENGLRSSSAMTCKCHHMMSASPAIF